MDAFIKELVLICAIYGFAKLIRDVPDTFLNLVFSINSHMEKIQLAKRRKAWEIIPDCGGTVEGSLEAVKIFANVRFMQRRG